MEDKEIKPCPCCGEDMARVINDNDFFRVRCDYCGLQTEVNYKDEEGAIDSWNNRPSPWHTGTPTEEGFWLVKYECVIDGKYKGRLTYRAVKIEKDKIDGFTYESGGIGAEEYWKPIEYQKIDDLWKGEE